MNKTEVVLVNLVKIMQPVLWSLKIMVDWVNYYNNRFAIF